MKFTHVLLLAVLAVAVVADQKVEVEKDLQAHETIAVPKVLTERITRLEKIIRYEEKSCADQEKEIQAEITTRQLHITKYTQRFQSIKKEVQRDQAQLEMEIQSIEKVKTMVVTALQSGKSATASQKAGVQADLQTMDPKSAKVQGVLLNIVESLGENRAEYTQIIELLDKLAKKLHSQKGQTAVEEESKLLNEKMTVEKGDIEVLETKKEKVTQMCKIRNSELLEVLTTLKTIGDAFEKIEVPNCKRVSDAKEEVNKKTELELEECKQREQVTVKALAECQENGSPGSNENLAKCTAELKTLTEEVERLKKVESTTTITHNTINHVTHNLAKCTGEVTQYEGKIAELRKALAVAEEKAKCTGHQKLIDEFQHTLRKFEVKADLLSHCTAQLENFKTQNTEFLKEMGKMTVLNQQLEQCNRQRAADMARAGGAAKAAHHKYQETVNKLEGYLKEQAKEITELRGAAKCEKYVSEITTIKKEITTIRHESSSQSATLTTELKGCKAGVAKAMEAEKAAQAKVSELAKNGHNYAMELQKCKIHHEHCLGDAKTARAVCKKTLEERNHCMKALDIESEKTTTLEKSELVLTVKKKQLQSKVASLAAEVDSLKKRVADLEKALSDERVKVASLTARLDEANKKIADLEKQLAELRDHRDQLKANVAAKETQIGNLEGALKEAKSDVDALKASLAKLVKEHEALQVEKTKTDGELKETQNLLAHWKDRSTEFENKFATAVANITSLEKELEEVRDLHKNAIAEHDKTKAELGNTHKELNACLAELENTKKGLATCEEEKAACQMELKDMTEKAKCLPQKQMVRAYKRANEKLQTELDACTKESTSLSSQLANAEAAIAAQTQQLKKLDSDVKQCKEAHYGCQEETKKLESKILNHLKTIKGHVNEKAVLSEKLAGCQVELASIKKQAADDAAKFRNFKDQMLQQMEKLIKLARTAKSQFDTVRVSMQNKMHIQDTSYEIKVKATLNYERILGDGVVKAEKKKLEAFEATRYATKKMTALKEQQAAIDKDLKKQAERQSAIAEARKKMAEHEEVVKSLLAKFEKERKAATEGNQDEDVQVSQVDSDIDEAMNTTDDIEESDDTLMSAANKVAIDN